MCFHRPLRAAAHDRGRRAIQYFASITARCLNRLYDPFPMHVVVNHLTEDNVFPIQPACHYCGDKELTPVCIRSGVGHAEQEGLVVFVVEILVLEFIAID